MSWQVEVKHDTKHRKWHRLRVSMKEPLSAVAALHTMQYAIDNQMNADCISFALVCRETGERIEHASNARINNSPWHVGQ